MFINVCKYNSIYNTEVIKILYIKKNPNFFLFYLDDFFSCKRFKRVKNIFNILNLLSPILLRLYMFENNNLCFKQY